MKITKRQLRKIIKEEKAFLEEQFAGDPGPMATKILDTAVDKLEESLI